MTKLVLCLMFISSFSISAMDMAFSRDDRSVDGDYMLLTLTGEGKEKNILLTKSFYSRKAGEVVTDTIFDMRSMTCTNWYFNFRVGNILHSIECVRDDKAVDGVKNLLVIEINKNNTFDVVLNKSFYSRMMPTEVKKTKLLTTNLELNL